MSCFSGKNDSVMIQFGSEMSPGMLKAWSLASDSLGGGGLFKRKGLARGT